MNNNIAVVILHYNDFEMTRNYINNLKKINWNGIDHHFIIVDNCSPDQSGKRLKKYYLDSEDVIVILSEKNLGFAKGNNLGIQYAKDTFKLDLIIVSNNDIVIEDNDIMIKILKIYEEEQFDVLGPDVYSTRRKIHQSPLRTHYMEENEIKQFVKKANKKVWRLNIIDKLKIYDILRKMKKSIVGKDSKNSVGYQFAQNQVVVSGAFFVLSKGYMNQYPDGLFPKTFMYLEEDILAYRVEIAHLKSVYRPQIKVLHLEGASTIRETGNSCKKYLFELNETIKSSQVMLDLINRERKQTFCTLYLPCSNVELTKDVGQIPYTLGKEHGIDTYVAGLNIVNDKNSDMFDFVKPIKIKKIFNDVTSGVFFLIKNAERFDWLNVYHGGRKIYFLMCFYKYFNSKGRIYLKLDMDFRLCDKYDVSNKERKIFQKVVEKADLVTVESAAVKERIQKYSPKQIYVISNGFQQSNCDLDIEHKVNEFLTVGRLGTEQKATEILLEAFLLSANKHDWNLRLVGSIEPAFEKYLDKFYCNHPEMKKRVIYEGSIADRKKLYYIYLKSKCFILPSRWESFGIAIAEALSCGNRLIISDNVPPVKEFTNNFEYGVVVSVEDIHGLSNAILQETMRSYKESDVLDMMDYANRNFSWSGICNKLYSYMQND